MRELFPPKKPGDMLEASHINNLSLNADYVARGFFGSYGQYRESTQSSDPPWVQNTVEITQIHDRNLGLFKVKIRYFDHTATGTPVEWRTYDESGEWFLDVSDWIDPNDSQNFVPHLVNLDVGNRVPAYWHLQRGAWVPICCPTPPDVIGSDDTGVLEHCCISVCDTVGGQIFNSVFSSVLFDTILPATATVYLLDPFTGEITVNIVNTQPRTARTYNISYCVVLEEGAASSGEINVKLQRDGGDDMFVDVPCPILKGETPGIQGAFLTLTSPVIVLDLVLGEVIRVQVRDLATGGTLASPNGSYLSICLNDCVVEAAVGSGSGV